MEKDEFVKKLQAMKKGDILFTSFGNDFFQIINCDNSFLLLCIDGFTKRVISKAKYSNAEAVTYGIIYHKEWYAENTFTGAYVFLDNYKCLFDSFKKLTVKECEIQYKDNGEILEHQMIVIDLPEYIRSEHLENDGNIFYYCNGISKFNKLLNKDNEEDFFITKYK